MTDLSRDLEDETARALCRVADALGLGHDPELTPEDVADAVEQLAAVNPRDEPYLFRVADALGIDREHMTGSYGIRQIEQLRRERDTFRGALDGAYCLLVKRARKLQPDDLLTDVESGRMWTVQTVEPDAFGVTLDLLAHRSGRTVKGHRIDHPDEPVTVLSPLVVRDGLLLLRRELGAQLVDYEPDAEPGVPS